MRYLDHPALTQFRDNAYDHQLFGRFMTPHERRHGGFFRVPSCVDAKLLTVVASHYRDAADDGMNPPWNHVSVSRARRTPTWGEMSQIKDLFFEPDETAMQLHVAASSHISNHPYCLHIWQPALTFIPLPPDWMVGIKDLGEFEVAKD